MRRRKPTNLASLAPLGTACLHFSKGRAKLLGRKLPAHRPSLAFACGLLPATESFRTKGCNHDR